MREVGNMKWMHVEETTSTNSLLRDMIREGYHATQSGQLPLLLSATRQTAGRGQGDHTWHSVPGQNLTFSILTHPESIHPARQFILSQACALAIRQALAEVVGDGEMRIKWPNDIYHCDKKICGTLIETIISGGRMTHAIFGMGINVNQETFPESLPNPTSLRIITGKTFNLEEILLHVAMQFTKQIDKAMCTEGEQSLSADYHTHLYLYNQWASFSDQDGTFEAQITGVSSQGQLLLNDQEGHERRYSLGEVKLNHSL